MAKIQRWRMMKDFNWEDLDNGVEKPRLEYQVTDGDASEGTATTYYCFPNVNDAIKCWQKMNAKEENKNA